MPPQTAARLLQSWVDEGACLGAQLYMWQEGQESCDLAFGDRAPGQPATAADAGPLLCATKPLVAACVAREVQESRLSFDDRVQRFIPSFRGGGRESITIRQLLSHQSRFPNLVSRPSPVDIAETVALACGPRLEPRHWYSRPTYNMTVAWCLLAEVLQRTLGTPVAAIIEDQVSGVLGARSLTLNPAGPGADRPYYRHASEAGYEPWQAGQVGGSVNPAHGGYGSMRDLGLFYVDLLGAAVGTRSRLLRHDVLLEMIRPHGAVWLGHPPAREPVGLGFFLHGGAVPGGGRLRSFSHLGSVGFRYPVVWSWADPRRRMVVAARMWSFGLRSEQRFQGLARAIARQPRTGP